LASLHSSWPGRLSPSTMLPPASMLNRSFNPDGFAVASCSGERRRYTSRIARSVKLVFGFAERPNNLLNHARSARWTSQGYASGCRLASTLGAANLSPLSR
jgi:hypothetical protein